MEREEHWRRRLLDLKEDLKLRQAEIADAMEVAPSYVSRLLYEPGKAGRKNLGLDTLRKLCRAYSLPADWFDLPRGTALPSHARQGTLVAREPPKVYELATGAKATWPFASVTLKRLLDLTRELGAKAGADAIRDIDAQLEIVVMKWERVLTNKKRRSNS